MWRAALFSIFGIVMPASGFAQGPGPLVSFADTAGAVLPVDTIADSTSRALYVAPRPQVGRAFAEILLLNGAAVAINNIDRDLG